MGAGNLAPHRDSMHGPSSPWRVAMPTELSQPKYSNKNWKNLSILERFDENYIHEAAPDLGRTSRADYGAPTR